MALLCGATGDRSRPKQREAPGGDVHPWRRLRLGQRERVRRDAARVLRKYRLRYDQLPARNTRLKFGLGRQLRCRCVTLATELIVVVLLLVPDVACVTPNARGHALRSSGDVPNSTTKIEIRKADDGARRVTKQTSRVTSRMAQRPPPPPPPPRCQDVDADTSSDSRKPPAAMSRVDGTTKKMNTEYLGSVVVPKRTSEFLATSSNASDRSSRLGELWCARDKPLKRRVQKEVSYQARAGTCSRIRRPFCTALIYGLFTFPHVLRPGVRVDKWLVLQQEQQQQDEASCTWKLSAHSSCLVSSTEQRYDASQATDACAYNVDAVFCRVKQTVEQTRLENGTRGQDAALIRARRGAAVLDACGAVVTGGHLQGVREAIPPGVTSPLLSGGGGGQARVFPAR
ncbi:hypothetical protein BIW11_01459 [Tropilaelaps mercedesae]|uniref:Uncharacterized protein n=1 Tax=Tropilaelaps mercedesae TaxID=418985 RepID=A0A1V9XDY7_9ACAR|nr:hypothetical protein BIW11_01459 [Tropilaelaps mercedesae]